MKNGLILQHALKSGSIVRLARNNGSGFILSLDSPFGRVVFAPMSVEEFARFQGEVSTVRETVTE